MPAYLPEILTTYNKREATQVKNEARKTCLHQAFRASFTLAASLYVRAADATQGGDFPLGEGGLLIEAVAQLDDVGLPGGEAGVHALPNPLAGVPQVQVLQHGVVHAHHVHQGQGIALRVPVQAVGEGQLSLGFPLRAEVHEDFVFNAAAGVGGQAHIFVPLEGGHPLDEPNGANGDEIVLISRLGVVFFHDMSHQAQIVLNEFVPGVAVPLGHAL